MDKVHETFIISLPFTRGTRTLDMYFRITRTRHDSIDVIKWQIFFPWPGWQFIMLGSLFFWHKIMNIKSMYLYKKEDKDSMRY